MEVNERVVARDMSRAVGVLTGLRSLGTRIHLDDFGSGNSPIGYLQRLPLDGVKIDHTLVNRMDRDEKALRLVRSVVGLAREFGLDVVAEELDIIVDVGRWVIRQTCRQVAAWSALRPEGERLTAAVNLSARQKGSDSSTNAPASERFSFLGSDSTGSDSVGQASTTGGQSLGLCPQGLTPGPGSLGG
ncbi:MAG: EAL domain-containing protein [Gemmatimonadetes bacterium]|nr:EAL domain-containing protein [Gemmatimonadota bacterium]